MVRAIEKISSFIAWVTGIVVVLQAAALVFSLLTSIFFRYVVGMALSWPEEISLILFTWMILLTISLGVREGFHVRLSIVYLRLPVKIRTVLRICIILAMGCFGGVLLFSGLDLIARTAKHLTPTLRLPLEWLNYSAPISGALIILHSIKRLLVPLSDED